MESRKAWRNRDASAGESVLALLEALRNGLGAQGVGLFDDDRADLDPNGPGAALNFLDAFDERPCAAIDWSGWYAELRKKERAVTTCGCGEAHHFYGYLIHGRWALLLVAQPTLDSAAAVAIASSLTALAAKLPPAKTSEEAKDAARYQPPPPPPIPPGGGPVWWVRKLPQ